MWVYVYLYGWACVHVCVSYAILSHYNLNNSMLLGGLLCFAEKYTNSEQKHTNTHWHCHTECAWIQVAIFAWYDYTKKNPTTEEYECEYGRYICVCVCICMWCALKNANAPSKTERGSMRMKQNKMKLRC